MPLKAELDAIRKAYMGLMKLPVKDLLPALKRANVVSDNQKEQMIAMTLDKERAGYLLDSVIIATLKIDIQESFYKFLQVLEDDHNPVVKVVANDLRLYLKQPQLPMRSFSCPAGHLSSPYSEYPPQPLDGQPSSLQHNLVHQLPIAEHPSPEQPYSYPGQPYPSQPLLGQQFNTGSYSYLVHPNCANPYSGQPNPGQPQQLSRSYSEQSNPVQPYAGQPNLVQCISEPAYNSGKPRPVLPSAEQPYPAIPELPNPVGQPQQFYRSISVQPYAGQPNLIRQISDPAHYPGQPYPVPPSPNQPYPGVPGQSNPGQQVYSGPNPGLPYPVQPSPRESHVFEYPQVEVHSVLIEQVEKILIRSSKRGIDALPANNRNVHAVCLIRTETAEGTEIGTGFIANLTMPNSSSPVTVLVTNHHVIHNFSEALEATYQFSYMRSDSDDTPCPISGEELIPHNGQGFYTCMESDRDDVLLDYTLIQVHERPLNDIMIKSELDGETFPLSTCKFDLDNPAMPSGIDEMETISILHYPRGQPLKRSTQGSVISGHLLFYSCDTDGGSSGAPVFKVVNKELRVIALHRGSWQDVKFNFGTLITDIVHHVKSEQAARMSKWNLIYNLVQRVKKMEQHIK